MRRFVVVGHTATTDPTLPLDDLAGGAGRLDVLCRCVGDALLTSHGVREDTAIWLVLQDAVTVRIDGGSVRNLSPDERTVAGLLRSAFAAVDRAVGAQPVESSPGVSVVKQGLAAALETAAEGGPVVQLHADGAPLESVDPPSAGTFVLSDHQDLTTAEQTLIDEASDGRVSLGPTALHADQAITVIHNHLDRTSR